MWQAHDKAVNPFPFCQLTLTAGSLHNDLTFSRSLKAAQKSCSSFVCCAIQVAKMRKEKEKEKGAEEHDGSSQEI